MQDSGDIDMASDLDSSFERKRHSSSPLISPESTHLQSSGFPEREGSVDSQHKVKIEVSGAWHVTSLLDSRWRQCG